MAFAADLAKLTDGRWKVSLSELEQMTAVGESLFDQGQAPAQRSNWIGADTRRMHRAHDHRSYMTCARTPSTQGDCMKQSVREVVVVNTPVARIELNWTGSQAEFRGSRCFG